MQTNTNQMIKLGVIQRKIVTMYMKQLLILVLFLNSGNLFSQKYGNIWCFGKNIGFDFNTCVPTIINSENEGFEGCATVCDNSGNLLFYTNSDTVWNKNHQAMPNGHIMSSLGSISQVLILPIPQNPDGYVIFTMPIQVSSGSFEYHEIDMSLDGGNGEVVTKHNLMSSVLVTEQIAATNHANGTDYWVVAHEYGTNRFLAYEVTSAGINLTPVESLTGSAHTSCTSNINARGSIKFSPDGTKIAFNANGIGSDSTTNILELSDFNNSTGVISNSISLPYQGGEYGLSFSPDNSRLYCATWTALGFTGQNHLYQFDLTSGDSATIANSKYIIQSTPTSNTFGHLKIGPDGKIYVARAHDYIGVINAPNATGAMCNYDHEAFALPNSLSNYGLNNYVEYTNYCEPLSVQQDKLGNLFKIFPNPAENLISISGLENTSNFNISILDLNGKLVMESTTSQVSIEDLQAGLYVIHVFIEGEESFVGKLSIAK